MVNAVHLRGKTVSAWTIDREKVATHMLELGVDDLITDKPDMVQNLLARNQQVDDSLIDGEAPSDHCPILITYDFAG